MSSAAWRCMVSLENLSFPPPPSPLHSTLSPPFLPSLPPFLTYFPFLLPQCSQRKMSTHTAIMRSCLPPSPLLWSGWTLTLISQRRKVAITSQTLFLTFTILPLPFLFLSSSSFSSSFSSFSSSLSSSSSSSSLSSLTR